jgi:transcriptional regulator with XRE-family HTH domain
MSPLQSRMARAALKWSFVDLAKNAHVGISTAQEFEKGARVRECSKKRLEKAFLNTEVIEFIGDNGLICKFD